MRPRSRAALGLSVAASLAYRIHPEIVVKGLSVSLLALVALEARQWLLAAALLLSSFGDVLLACGERYFLAGLGAFLCAHLVYVVLFVRHRAPAAGWAFTACLMVYGLVFGAWLSPSLGALRIPVFCYIAAILAMAASASRADYRNRWVMIGAILFLISDSLLGAVRFRMAIPLSGILVWSSYYAGQCAITLGALLADAKPHIVWS